MSGNTIVTFSSLEFIFRFLPFFLAVFYLATSRYRKKVLFIGSLVFYGLGDLVFLPLLAGMTVLNYRIGRQNLVRRERGLLSAAVILNVGVLAGFKLAAVSLPLGLSFYLFKMLSYQADCFQGKLTEHDFWDAAVYFCMFPQLVSGPIMRMGQMQGSFDRVGQDDAKNRIRRGLLKIEKGLFYFTAGLGAKVLLADRLGLLWHDLASVGYESISMPLAWLGAFAYSLQLYFDFAGYSLMAGGIGVMLGLPFVRNFAHPYASCSVREFFRRWHMTLGSWFRDYVYIPLGGSRSGKKRCILNLAVVWLLTGLWHGMSANFLLWGIGLLILVTAEKLFLGELLSRHRLLGHVYIIMVMPVIWVVFALSDPGQLGLYLSRMFPFLRGFFGRTAGVVQNGDFWQYGKLYAPFFTAGVICCLPSVIRFAERRRRSIWVTVGMTAIFWISVYVVSNAVSNPFLYFSF